MATNRNMYEDAILCQDACNASGLIKSLASHLDAIWEEARAQEKGTDYVNFHPVIRLFLEQLVFLNGGSYQYGRPWLDAMDICRAKALLTPNKEEV